MTQSLPIGSTVAAPSAPSAAPRRHVRQSRKSQEIIYGAFGLALVVLFWQLAGTLHWISSFFISSPTAVWRLLVTWVGSGTVYPDILTTATESFGGLAIGMVAGVVLAFALYSNATLRKVFFPLLTILMGLPRVVLAPLFMIWFGIGIMSKLWLVVSVVSLIVFFSTYAGMQETDKQLIAKTRLLGASTWQVYRHVLGPSVLVWVMSSIRTSMGIAITAAVVGEYIGSTSGIGYLIATAQGNLDSTGVYAGLVLTGFLVLVIEVPVRRAESHFRRWKVNLAD